MPPPASGPIIRAATRQDCTYLAELHAATLAHGFFVELGPRFLRAYHRSFVQSPHARGYIAAVDGQAVGGLVGAVDNRAHWGWTLRQQGVRLALAGVVGLLRRPGLIIPFLRTRAGRYTGAVGRLAVERSRPRRSPKTPPAPRVAVLTHVCVDPAVQGKGVGGALVEAFLQDARAARAAEAMLVTLAGNAGAGEFYARRGWTYAGDRTDPDGRPLHLYTRTLP